MLFPCCLDSAQVMMSLRLLRIKTWAHFVRWGGLKVDFCKVGLQPAGKVLEGVKGALDTGVCSSSFSIWWHCLILLVPYSSGNPRASESFTTGHIPANSACLDEFSVFASSLNLGLAERKGANLETRRCFLVGKEKLSRRSSSETPPPPLGSWRKTLLSFAVLSPTTTPVK